MCFTASNEKKKKIEFKQEILMIYDPEATRLEKDIRNIERLLQIRSRHSFFIMFSITIQTLCRSFQFVSKYMRLTFEFLGKKILVKI